MDHAETIEELAELLSGAEYGAPSTVEHAGTAYRCRVEIDEYTNVMDEEFWGAFAFVERDRCTGWDRPRPSGFDGRARKIQSRSGDPLWWQPPADVPAEHFAEFQANLLDLLEYGYVGIVVERLDGTDAYGRPIVVDVASLWGVECFVDDAYKVEIISEKLHEVGA